MKKERKWLLNIMIAAIKVKLMTDFVDKENMSRDWTIWIAILLFGYDELIQAIKGWEMQYRDRVCDRTLRDIFKKIDKRITTGCKVKRIEEKFAFIVLQFRKLDMECKEEILGAALEIAIEELQEEGFWLSVTVYETDTDEKLYFSVLLNPNELDSIVNDLNQKTA